MSSLSSPRVQYKSIIRQYPKRRRLINYLQRLGIFVIFVLCLSAFRYLSNSNDYYNSKTTQSINFESSIRSKTVDTSSILTDNETTMSNDVSHVVIGGTKLERNQCLHDHLMRLPHYAEDFCKDHPDNCTGLSCLNLLSGVNLDRYESIIDLIPPKSAVIPENSYEQLTKNCAKYKQNSGYVLKSLNEESKNFPLAFNILVHSGVGQFELLLKSLYRPQNSFCVHVDKKTSQEFQKAVNNIIKCFDNVYLASSLETISWGGYNRLQADITCMRDQLTRNITWKYLINTAGQAYPLRTVEEMVKILKIYNGANDIEGIYGKRIIRGRFENEWIETSNGITKTGKLNPKPPHDIDIVRGSAYGIFSRSFVEFIINDKRAIDLLRWSQKTWSPDEIYWATLHHTYSNPHLKTPGGFNGVPDKKEWLAVYANWGYEPCHGKRVRGVCVQGFKDVQALVGRKEFFINKFYEDLQPLGLSCLSAWIDFKQTCRVPFDDTFYRGLNFIMKNDR